MQITSATGKKAFSLIELLISISILSIGIVVILQALSFSSRVTGLSNDIINATFLARDKLQEFEFKEKYKLIKETNDQQKTGRFTDIYSVSLDSVLGLYRTNILISWDRMNRKNEVALTTYLTNETK